jgi:hypothetical protein
MTEAIVLPTAPKPSQDSERLDQPQALHSAAERQVEVIAPNSLTYQYPVTAL